MARVTSQTKAWTNVKDMKITFSTPRRVDTPFSIQYSVSPQNAPNSDVLKKLDFISLRLVVDGMPYKRI